MCAKQFATVNRAEKAMELESPLPGEPWQAEGTACAAEAEGPGLWTVRHGGKAQHVLVQKVDREERTVRMRIGGGSYTVKLTDERDRLLHMLGLDQAKGAVLKELKAPMPGLVLKVMVKEGDVVRKNDPLLILEAMKMENVIKSTGDATVKKVHAQERAAVEKGQLLLSFEP